VCVCVCVNVCCTAAAGDNPIVVIYIKLYIYVLSNTGNFLTQASIAVSADACRMSHEHSSTRRHNMSPAADRGYISCGAMTLGTFIFYSTEDV
jgi:hypothetical protein